MWLAKQENGMTNQSDERKFADKSTNVGQQQHGNVPNDKSGQHQQSHTGQGQQGNEGSKKGSGQQHSGKNG